MVEKNKPQPNQAVMHRVRVSASDVHYAGGLVDGAYILKLFGDVATELMIRQDGVEGLFRAYESVEFLAPVFGGDMVEVFGEIIKIGKSSRKMSFVAHKVIEASRDPQHPEQATVLVKPLKVAQAVGTCVVPQKDF